MANVSTDGASWLLLSADAAALVTGSGCGEKVRARNMSLVQSQANTDKCEYVNRGRYGSHTRYRLCDRFFDCLRQIGGRPRARPPPAHRGLPIPPRPTPCKQVEFRLGPNNGAGAFSTIGPSPLPNQRITPRTTAASAWARAGYRCPLGADRRRLVRRGARQSIQVPAHNGGRSRRSGARDDGRPTGCRLRGPGPAGRVTTRAECPGIACDEHMRGFYEDQDDSVVIVRHQKRRAS